MYTNHKKHASGVYDVAGIRLLEVNAINAGISSDDLMQRAGAAVFQAIKHHFPSCKRVGIVVGGGNNGGDGLVAASYLAEAGFAVTVWQVGKYHSSVHVFNAFKRHEIPYHPFDQTTDFSTVDLLVDAILGIGLQQQLKLDVQCAVDLMNQSGVPIVAIDIPTGIQADSGKALGRPIMAALTVSFIGIKSGLLSADGIQYAGTLIVDDLQLPAALFNLVGSIAQSSDLDVKLQALPKRHANWHKGLSGHVLILGGAPGFSGAPKMAALAALRVGAGLVSVVMHKDQMASFDNDHPEIMCHGVTDDLSGVQQLLKRATVIVVGPGLGVSDWSKSLLELALREKVPLLLDADALNLLSSMQVRRDNWVLTPHPGEAARLLHIENHDIQQDRFAAVKQLVTEYGGIAVLKGARTCVSDGAQCEVSLSGNPGMATAGLGDILSGVIGGLMAQGLSGWEAATLGVLLHGVAGDLAVAADGMRGMVATDLLPYIRGLINQE